MSDLGVADRSHCMNVVFAVERVLRRTLSPVKINLASLGNMVAHIHWHVIPRFPDDPHFPLSVWSPAQRQAPERQPGPLSATLAGELAAELNAR
jgi:diadenosine tetraphosphate (Ap4A) HIT family hydrolase